jgi:hypothetical protein
MMITKRAVPRRTVLRGLGATLALPLLDAMVPALTAAAKTAAQPVRRVGFVYFPNGANMPAWTPATAGTAFELSPTLSPLAPLREYLTVLSGLDNLAADARGDGGGDHPRSPAAWLSAVHPKRREGADVECGQTVDQLIAAETGKQTQLASLELSLEPGDLAGRCGAFGYACIYSSTISWRTATAPLPMETNPRYVFERLFGEGTNGAERLAVMRQNRSILDSVLHDLGSFRRKLGPGDRLRITEYTDSIRDVERRIQRSEKESATSLVIPERPVGIPDTFEEHCRLMYDLQVLAFQADITRVTSFMLGREVSQRTFPVLSISDAHHAISHHQDDPEKQAKIAKIDKHFAGLFGEFLQKLRNTPDGDGNLLEHSMILYGACISEAQRHLHSDLPLLVAGHGAGQLKGGTHLQYKDVPMGNLLVSLAGKMGVTVEAIGESTGSLTELSGV